MPGLNKAQIIGFLGDDPAFHKPQNERAQSVLRFNVATNYKSSTGKETTEWHRIVVFGRPAEAMRDHLRKGRLVYVEGRIASREYHDKKNIRRWTTEIIASRVDYLDKAPRRPDAPHPAGEPENEPRYDPHTGEVYG